MSAPEISDEMIAIAQSAHQHPSFSKKHMRAAIKVVAPLLIAQEMERAAGIIAEKDAQLRRLLKAENDEWVGVIERSQLREVADDTRSAASEV